MGTFFNSLKLFKLGFLRKIRIYFGQRSLLADSLKVVRVKKPINITNATTIGIIYHLSSEEEYNSVSYFTKKLQEQGKKVHVMGLYESSRIPVYYIPKLSYDLILLKDIDLFYRPKGKFVEEFIQSDFDILIDLSSPDNFTLNYIAVLSKASFKVGRKIDDRSLPYDIMIDAGPEVKSQELIEQVVHYTNNMKFDQ